MHKWEHVFGSLWCPRFSSMLGFPTRRMAVFRLWYAKSVVSVVCSFSPCYVQMLASVVCSLSLPYVQALVCVMFRL